MEKPASHVRPSAVFIAIGGVYVGQSVIGGLTYTGLPAILRQGGFSLEHIGLLYLVIIPWALKFLWAPMVEQFRLPAHGKNRSGIIVLTGGLIAAAGLFAIGALGPVPLVFTISCLVMVGFAAATVDIACDGFAVETLAQKHQGWGNAAQVGGAYLGSAIGSGVFLVLYAYLGWSFSVFAMAATMLLLILPFFILNRRIQHVQLRQHMPSLRTALRRTEVRKGIVLAVFFVAAQKWGIVMLGPYMIDSGIDLLVMGMVNGTGGLLVGFCGALLGGLAVRLLGTRTVLLIALCLQSVMLLSFAIFSSLQNVPQILVLVCALASTSGIMAFGFVALYAHFMRLSDPRQAGVDFTIFQCTDSVISMIGGVASGAVAGRFGYSALFLAGMGIAVAAIPFIANLTKQSTVSGNDAGHIQAS